MYPFTYSSVPGRSTCTHLNHVAFSPLFIRVFSGDVRPLHFYARIGGGLDDPQRIVVGAQFYAAGLQIGCPPGVVVLPQVGVCRPVAMFVEPGVVAPAVDTDHLVAVRFQVPVHPFDVSRPFLLGDVSVGCEAVLVRAPVQRRPVRFRRRSRAGVGQNGVCGDGKGEDSESRDRCLGGAHKRSFCFKDR